jgi:hypothetical protein
MDRWPDVNADQPTIRQLFEKEAAHFNEVGQGRIIRLLGAQVWAFVHKCRGRTWAAKENVIRYGTSRLMVPTKIHGTQR